MEPNKRTKPSKSGLGQLQSGQPFISNWPSSKRAADVHLKPGQSLVQATNRWLEHGIQIAREMAADMDGQSVLLSGRTLRCTSNFTGFHVLMAEELLR